MLTGWWLTFDKSSNSHLEGIIKNLSIKYSEGKAFVPHLSIYSYTEMTIEDADRLANKIASFLESFNVDIYGVGFETKVSKTLYLKIKTNSHLREINNFMEEKFKNKFKFDPHISLIYKRDLPIKEREALVKTIKIPGKLRVDSISYYQIEEKYKSAEFFYKWQKPVRIRFKIPPLKAQNN